MDEARPPRRLREWGPLAGVVAGLIVVVGLLLQQFYGFDPEGYCRAATRGFVDGQITYNQQVNALANSLGSADITPNLKKPTRERFEFLVSDCVEMRAWERSVPVRDEE